MDISNMLSDDTGGGHFNAPQTGNQDDPTVMHPYPTRRTTSMHTLQETGNTSDMMDNRARKIDPVPSGIDNPKTVSFELLVDEARKARARLPMRVQIHPHDSTEEIISSVKGFFGLYDDPQGVSFEDSNGKSIIAQYDHFSNNSTVSVRVIPDYATVNETQNSWAYRAGSPQRSRNIEDGAPILAPPQPAQILNYGQPPSRPLSRVSRKESLSPKPINNRLNAPSKSRPRQAIKGQSSSFQAGLDELNDAHNGYSSSDGIAASVSSRKARSEQLATAEISVDNIVEGGRRKRAKFESSELPLFVPPQVPAPNSISSVSPQRRVNGMEVDSPFIRPQQRTITYQVPVQSPQGDGFGPVITSTPRTGGFTVPAVPNHTHRLRDRSSGASVSNRSSLGSTTFLRGNNVLPTPDPTIASCISDEDVALQLMRLGEASNFSHGRHSTSTFDDSLSGHADVASSDSDNSENEVDSPDQPLLPTMNIKSHSILSAANPQHPVKKEPNEHWPSTDGLEPSADEVDDDYEDHSHRSDADEYARKRQKTMKVKKTGAKPTKLKTSGSKKLKQQSGNFNLPMSPASIPSQSRKASFASTANMSYALGPDEDDLSSKPRCQRCRKSKKGCDRQRPCGRCKDAGIGVDGCVSEDENNGRKGRYGRHMGVAIKKGAELAHNDHESERAGAILSGMASGSETGKKRKRA